MHNFIAIILQRYKLFYNFAILRKKTKPKTNTMQEVLPYNDYSSWTRRFFPYRVQKISIDAGFSCPNRDGKVSLGGCSFCDNNTFNPTYCDAKKSVTQQLEEGKAFFGRKYPEMKYLAYFQAYSNTYAPLERLRKLYEEALKVEDVVGIVIGTRPDCIDEEKIAYIKELSERCFVVVEYGVESTYDSTLKVINRGHTFEQSRRAVEMTHEAGILCGGHIIIGLPGETHDMTIRSAEMISALPLDFLKIHQLQIIRNTRLAMQWERERQNGEVPTVRAMELDEYIETVAHYIGHLRQSLILERFVSQSPADMLLAPRWGLKNHEFTHLLIRYMREHEIKQGIFI